MARRLWDGTATAVREDWAVAVDGPLIRAVGPGDRLAAEAPTDEVLDLGDVTLLPGLVDAHQHLCLDASDDPVGHLTAVDDAALLSAMRVAAARALAAGITTVRDLGDRGYLGLTLRKLVRDGAEPGPRIIASGPPITVPGGHCWFLGGETVGAMGMRGAVRDRADRGVDVIKVMATGGNLTPTVPPHESQYTAGELRVAVEAAHDRGLPVAVHAHGAQGIVDALAAGVDSIEHCTFFTADGVAADPAVLEALASSGVALSLTPVTLPGRTAVHPAIRVRLDAIMSNIRRLYALHARIVCASDAGVGESKPHDVLPQGLAAFAGAIGLAPAEALACVTSVPAEVCGVGDVTGTIEPGKAADMLAVAGNPLVDLTALVDVRSVHARGVRVR